MKVVPFRKRTTVDTGTQLDSVTFDTLPEKTLAIGIDLGTTNTVVSVYRESSEKPETLLYECEALVPSLLVFDAETQREIVGLRARDLLVSRPLDVVKSTKTHMGTTKTFLTSGERSYLPEEAAEVLLKYLVSHPVLEQEAKTNGEIWAVITVPAHFNDAARRATIAAAQKAGVKVLRLVNEPTAAALAYSLLPHPQSFATETLAVYDFGGGTFDVSVVERTELIFNVTASEGDVHLGGDDIDQALAEHLATLVVPSVSPLEMKLKSHLMLRLKELAQSAKRRFVADGVVHLQSETIDDAGHMLDVVLDRNTFDELAVPFIQRTLFLTESAMHAAKLRRKKVSRILLVGGSSKLPLVRKMLTNYFPDCTVDESLEPDLAVSWGASVQAAILLGRKPDTVLVDVCSHTLGVGVAQDRVTIERNFARMAKQFGIKTPLSESELAIRLGNRALEFQNEMQKLLEVAPIIHRNSSLPACRSEFFTTLYDSQLGVNVLVVQGEGLFVGENKLLGSFLFELEQPCPSGTKCELQFTYDANGIVHVLAKQHGSDNVAHAEFSTKDLDKENSEPASDTDRTSSHPKVSLLAQSHSSHRAVGLKSVTTGQSAARSAPGSTQPPADAQVLNALAFKTRKALEKNDYPSDTRRIIEDALKTYCGLLSNAQNGAENDDLLEAAEDRLKQLIEV